MQEGPGTLKAHSPFCGYVSEALWEDRDAVVACKDAGIEDGTWDDVKVAAYDSYMETFESLNDLLRPLAVTWLVPHLSKKIAAKLAVRCNLHL